MGVLEGGASFESYPIFNFALHFPPFLTYTRNRSRRHRKHCFWSRKPVVGSLCDLDKLYDRRLWYRTPLPHRFCYRKKRRKSIVETKMVMRMVPLPAILIILKSIKHYFMYLFVQIFCERLQKYILCSGTQWSPVEPYYSVRKNLESKIHFRVYTPFFKGYIPVYEGEMKHFGGPNRCKNEGKRREGETKGLFFSGAPSGAQKSIKSIDFEWFRAEGAKIFWGSI